MLWETDIPTDKGKSIFEESIHVYVGYVGTKMLAANDDLICIINM